MIVLAFIASVITEMPAYKRLARQFQERGYTQGNTEHKYYKSDISIANIPKSERFEYLRQHLTGCHDDYIAYVVSHPKQFNKQFFKDLIAINYYSLFFEKNIFEWMDEAIIDEELVMCAMFRAVNMRYCERRDECDDWFYSVKRRKPELLTQEMYILGARCFASKRNGANRFLEITPDEYRTEEYYHALCTRNDTPVMEDIPEEILTSNFLVDVLNDSIESVQCFTEAALETEVPVQDRGILKVWQAVMVVAGNRARLIPLNEERIEYFFSLYSKDSCEYEYGFKRHYKEYLRKKNSVPAPDNGDTMFAGMATLLGIMGGMSSDEAIDRSSKAIHDSTDRKTCLPVFYGGPVPAEYSKKYDKEEYLFEIYKKLGIKVLGEANYYFFDVRLPKDITIVKDEYDKYLVKRDDETVIVYYDRGSFYDRDVMVCDIRVSL